MESFMNFLNAGKVEGGILRPTICRIHSMKFILSRFTTALIALAAVASSAQAANITLDGYGFYSLSRKVTYKGNPPHQGGRYKNLGSDYYHNITYQMDFITNRSNSGSGSLSWEFWAKTHYDAKSGIILITRGVSPMSSTSSIKNANKSGAGIYLDAKRYPEMNIWEYTNSGWEIRDLLTFTRKIFL